MEKIISIRGATTLLENSKDEIVAKTIELVSSIVKANDLLCDRVLVANCMISSTADIDQFYPAAAITQSGILQGVPLFSSMEPKIIGSMPLCIRLMITAMCPKDYNAKHIYLHEARGLTTNCSSQSLE